MGCSFKQTEYNRIEPLFRSWYRERMQQLSRSLATTVENGNNVTTRNPFKIFMRDWYLWLISFSPAMKHSLHLGGRREGMVHYEHEADFPFLSDLNGGGCLPQVYCKALTGDASAESEVSFTDDVIWNTSKKGLFKFCVFVKSANDLSPALDTIEPLLNRDDTPSFMKPENATVLIEDISTQNGLSKLGWDIHRLASGDEFAKSKLCEGRRDPVGYDHTILGREVQYKRFLFLRPDRFVFAACDTLEEVETAMQQVTVFLGSASAKA